MNKFTAVAAYTVAIIFATSENTVGKEIIYAAISNGRLEKLDNAGTSLGGFSIPSSFSIAVDRVGNVYANPLFSPNVLQFDNDGTPLAAFSPTMLPGDDIILLGGSAFDANDILNVGVTSGGGPRVERFMSNGASLGLIPMPSAALSLAFDESGNLFVSSGNDGIRKFDPNGAPLGVFVTLQGFARDIAFDSVGNLYVVTGSSSISVYDSSGSSLNTFSVGFSANTVALDENDILYVGGSDSTNPAPGVIRRFQTDGTPLGLFFQSPPPPPGFLYEVTDIVIVNAVPEPTSFVLATIAACGMALVRCGQLPVLGCYPT